MEKFDLVVKIIVDDLREQIENDYKDYEITTWHEMLEAFGSDSKQMQEDIEYILTKYSNKNDVEIFLNDLHELEDENGNFISYRQITNKVRKELFNQILKSELKNLNKKEIRKMKKNYYDFRISLKELEEREEEGRLDNLFIVFEEDEGQCYDLSYGVFEGFENAKEFADGEIGCDKYILYVANYKDWLEGSYDYLYVKN